MNGMPEIDYSVGDWKGRLQIHGVLLKKSANQSKWMRRYVVVRDGWLLYYPETEKRDMTRRNYFNVHPKAAIPLGECKIVPSTEYGQSYSIVISSGEIEFNLTLAAENEYDQSKWMEALEKSKRITWSNQQLSDGLIRRLEEHGQSMAQQKQEYFDRLQSEVLELADEKERTWELEKMNEELEKEKARMEAFNEEMKEEYDKVKRELEEMQAYMKDLDTERQELSTQLNKQVEDLQRLASEKESIVMTLKQKESVAEKLSVTEEEMRRKLKDIEEQTNQLLRDKAEAEQRLQDNELRAQELEEEKEMYNEQAHELQSTIKDLTTQKEMTERELKEEIIARMAAERRLQEAEASLQKLGLAVENETPNIEQDVKDQMVVNVNKLKTFFENLAEEAKVDPGAPVVVKNSIHARKTIMRRNKTRKFETRKSSSMRVKSMDLESVLLRASNIPNQRRAQSTYVRGRTITGTEEGGELEPVVEVFSERF